ncbi:centrosomal protein of 44 kDa [Genypterus blacodes]|uniref:centrosomal protein of 44 kDa n=1 Tax=Genypterus blacodes TaxID=154954 RepID=UPI003F7741BB
MLSAGDVQSFLRKLETLLRAIKYPGPVDYNGLSKGDPSAFLPIVSFTLTSYSPVFAEQLVSAGLELTGKTDLRFTDTLYKVLRDMFHYKPVLSKQQFLQLGFPQRKISVICDIIDLVLQRHNQLKKPSVKYPVTQSCSRGGAHPPQSSLHEPLSNRPLVVSHPVLASSFYSSHIEQSSPKAGVYGSYHVACTSYSPEDGITEMTRTEQQQKEDEEGKEKTLIFERRISALEAQVKSLLSGFDRLSILEKRIETLEKQENTHKNKEQVINVSRETWENLLSRLLLLETKQELSNTQPSVLPPTLSQTCSSTLVCDSSQEDLKDQLERITNMMKSTSSLLKNTEPSMTHFS